MADVWISTGRRFCEICKCWFGNNKISQDHHERGDRHKAALANRIREATMKNQKRDIEQAKMNSTLAQMEAAAAASMISHGEGLTHGPALPSTGLQMNIFDPRKHKDIGAMAQEMANRREGVIKRKGLSGADFPAPEARGGPPAKMSVGGGMEDVASAYRDLTNPAAGPALPAAQAMTYIPQTQQTGEISWVQAKDKENGKTYYWNIFDGSTRWDQPSYFYSPQQYEKKVKEFEEAREKYYYGTDEVHAVRQGKKSLESYIKDKIAESGLQRAVEANREELGYNKQKKDKKQKPWERRRAERDAQRAKQEEEEQEAIPNEDIPLPPDDQGPSSYDQHSNYEEPEPEPEPKYNVWQKNDPSPEPEPQADEEKAKPMPEDERSTLEQLQASKGPFGGWIRITEAEKKERDQPFESPLTARFRELEEKQKQDEEEKIKEESKHFDPAIEFEEKVAPTTTKKVKGPIEFKKKSASRSIRKREETE